MEDFEMTQALRRYVEAGEPPFPLTANALILQARRRQRWRLGMVVGGGGAATTLAIVSAMALVPTGGGGPALGPGGVCDVRLPRVPGPSPYLTSLPTGQVIPWPVLSRRPTPSRDPDPVNEPQPYPGGGSADPTMGEHVATIVIGNPRLAEMSCFLKHRLIELRPTAKFAPHLADPMEVRFASAPGPDGRKIPVYEASAYIIDGRLLCLFSVKVIQGDYGLTPGLGHSENQAVATYKTKSSTIVVSVEGGAIGDADLMGIAKAPQLDMFR